MKKIFILPFLLIANSALAEPLESRATTRYTNFTPYGNWNESVISSQIVPSAQTIPVNSLPLGAFGSPSLGWSGTTVGFYADATHLYLTLAKTQADFMFYPSGGLNFRSDGGPSFSSNTDASGGADVAYRRNSAGVGEINSGGAINTPANYRDLILRTLISGTTTAVAVANVAANSCGTTAATIAGNENDGAFTVGATSGTQCRITFTTTSANRRHCIANDETTTITTRATFVDSTHVDFFGAFVAGDVVTYHCFSR